MGYSTTIIEVGPDASDFLAEQMAIIFAGNAPEELRSYCFVIDKSELTSPLAVGQPVLIGDQESRRRTWARSDTSPWSSTARRNRDCRGRCTSADRIPNPPWQRARGW